jgi:hypothetical protein
MKFLKISSKMMLIVLFSLSLCISGYTQVPDWYQGKPYKGKPQVIPGRVEFEYHDSGAFGVTFKTDYINGGPIKDIRPGETQFMSIDETNIGEIDPTNGKENIDKYNDGTLYPGETNKNSCYVGWTHVGDWTRFTVHVTKSDDYRISSVFAQGEGSQIGFTMKFNNNPAKEKKIVLNYGTGGSWHSWRRFDDFTTVHLDSGLVMIEFLIDIHHLNYDYLEFRSANAPAVPQTFITDSLKDNLVHVSFSSVPSVLLSKTDSIKIKRGPELLEIDSVYIDPLHARSFLIRLNDTLHTTDNNLTISWPENTIVTPNNVEGDSLAETKINNILPAATPVIVKAATEKRLSKIYLQFSKRMKNPAAIRDSILISYNGIVIDSIVSIALSKTDAKTIVVVPYKKYFATDTIAVSYIGSGYYSVDNGELEKFSGFAVENTPGEIPVPVSASTNTTGNMVSLIFSEPISRLRFKSNEYMLLSEDGSINVKSVALDNSFSWKLNFNVAPLILPGSVCYISYNGSSTTSNKLVPLEKFDSIPVVINTIPVGIEENNSENNTDFYFYPNPANTYLNLKTNHQESNYTVNIYNEAGVLLYSSVNNENSVTIPLSSFKEGMYFINYTNKDITETQKFSIAR